MASLPPLVSLRVTRSTAQLIAAPGVPGVAVKVWLFARPMEGVLAMSAADTLLLKAKESAREARAGKSERIARLPVMTLRRGRRLERHRGGPLYTKYAEYEIRGCSHGTGPCLSGVCASARQ